MSQAATGGSFTYPPAPYDNGRYSNGPVAVEQLWQLFNPGDTSFKPSLAGGTNYAIGGATSGMANYNSSSAPPPLNGAYANLGTAWQLGTFVSQAPAFNPANSLFVVWLFPNDVFNYSLTGQLPGNLRTNTPAGGPLVNGNQLAINGIDNIITTVTTLAAYGGRHFLVPTMPNLSLTPGYAGDSALNDLSNGFNFTLAAALNALQAAMPSLDIITFDTNAVFRDVIDHKASYGLTETGTACLSDQNCNPNTWLFWDSVHPTAKGQQILADKFFGAVLPEPSSIALLAVTLFGFAAARQRRRL